ncbi:MAG: hypothetical protein ACRD68_15590, partial [Pyrinomonadaceae bacterium]
MKQNERGNLAPSAPNARRDLASGTRELLTPSAAERLSNCLPARRVAAWLLALAVFAQPHLALAAAPVASPSPVRWRDRERTAHTSRRAPSPATSRSATLAGGRDSLALAPGDTLATHEHRPTTRRKFLAPFAGPGASVLTEFVAQGSFVPALSLQGLKVSPVVECVLDRGNGAFTGWFGYNNPNVVPVTIPLGTANKFTPTPAERGQAVTFQPGRHRNVFAVAHTGGNLVWTLNGKTATASLNHPTRCRPVSVQVASPVNNSETTAASIIVSGTAASAGPNPAGIARVYVNDAEAVCDAATGNWTAANVALGLGVNTITARAVDQAGYESGAQISV